MKNNVYVYSVQYIGHATWNGVACQASFYGTNGEQVDSIKVGCVNDIFKEFVQFYSNESLKPFDDICTELAEQGVCMIPFFNGQKLVVHEDDWLICLSGSIICMNSRLFNERFAHTPQSIL